MAEIVIVSGKIFCFNSILYESANENILTN